MSTSTTFSNCSTLAENWDTETLINFLRDLNINLDEDDFKILRKEKIDGQIFPDMTEKKFMKDGMKRGPVMKLEKQAKIFREKSRDSEKGKIEYFWLFPCGVWSLQHFISWSTNMFGLTERNEAYTVFYNTLYIFHDDPIVSQEIYEVVKNLLLKKKVSGKKGRNPLADTSNLQEEIIEKPVSSKSDSLVSSIPIAKKRSISKVLNASADIPLRDDKSIDILEILKTAVRDFDQGIIALRSSRSYKSSNHLYVNSEHYIKVPRESTYDAEMYRVLVNWLRKIHGYEITGQWHFEQVCDDGDYHHLYCDLTIKKPENPHLEALLELLAMASISKLDGHFEKVFKYEEQLHSREIWIVHFSREDYVVTNLYWPSEKLQEKGLNVVHFWHDRDLKM
ncbi:P-loop containing nucleoside triphosphate hydrolase protein [Rhizophagus clarus]|uniref:P-loop containing nucleoside triphosphate hydrolase protein n=1 Tax=Rhizophagus clarus TaxID=94130 RepID=A0A8H3QYD1_9GLOM|nr:P-loop containing nucleoside triphosphate hydrolase protein [Rhizophagus clarus]